MVSPSSFCHTLASPCVLFTRSLHTLFGTQNKKKMLAYDLEVQPYCFLYLCLSSFLCFFCLFFSSPSFYSFLPSSLLPPPFQFQFSSHPFLVACSHSAPVLMAAGPPLTDLWSPAGVAGRRLGTLFHWRIDCYWITNTSWWPFALILTWRGVIH